VSDTTPESRITRLNGVNTQLRDMSNQAFEAGA
jgi:hypothetical protein